MSHPLWESIKEQLAQQGIDLDAPEGCAVDEALVRAICVVPDLGESVRKLSESPRDQVVMVRIDADALEALDSWVQSGAVRSRSEAAALFIQEGLNVHARELEQLRGALHEVEKAKRRLQKRVKDLLESED